MPTPRPPVRYTCGHCGHRWVFGPTGDSIALTPGEPLGGLCPKCRSDKRAKVETLPWGAIASNNFFGRLTGKIFPKIR